MKLIPHYLISFLIFASISVLSAAEFTPVRKIADFVLTDQNGNSFDSSNLKGSVWIADFIFTRCQGMCPLMSGRMAELQKRIKDSRIKLVSFSVDPEFDTPKVLKKYSERFNADPSRWFFLTGPREMIWNLIISEFQLGVDRANEEDLKQGAEPVMHSNRFVLVDQAGKVRGYFDSNEPVKLDELVALAQQLSKGNEHEHTPADT